MYQNHEPKFTSHARSRSFSRFLSRERPQWASLPNDMQLHLCWTFEAKDRRSRPKLLPRIDPLTATVRHKR